MIKLIRLYLGLIPFLISIIFLFMAGGIFDHETKGKIGIKILERWLNDLKIKEGKLFAKKATDLKSDA